MQPVVDKLHPPQRKAGEAGPEPADFNLVGSRGKKRLPQQGPLDRGDQAQPDRKKKRRHDSGDDRDRAADAGSPAGSKASHAENILLVVSQRPAKEKRGHAKRNYGKAEQKEKIEPDRTQPGVLQEKLLEAVHGIGERIHS
jgi:hypothetical protein